MTHTSPIVKFITTELTGTDIKSASIVEEFDPLSTTLPITTLELIIYSKDVGFYIIDPTGEYILLQKRQPIVVYEEVGTSQELIGQFYLDTWENVSDTLIKLNCIDIIGILDTLPYKGGIWLSPITMGDLLDEILREANVPYVIDPDLISFPLTGWIPYTTVREALKQIAFACGASITCARQNGFIKFSKMYMTGAISKGIRCGVGACGQSRIRQQSWRLGTWDASYAYVRCGVSGTGQSRNYQRRWRPGTWGRLIGDITISKSEKGMQQSLTLKTQCTGVEVTAHDIIKGAGSLELYKNILPAGEKLITFKQPMHSLTISGATITDSGANYAVINVASESMVVLSGLVYIDTRQTYSQYMEDLDKDTKINIIKITDATMVNSTNAIDVTNRIYNYYQQRYLQKVRLYSPHAAIGNIVVVDTLYDRHIRGIVEKMSIDLAGGYLADTEITGIVTTT